MFHFSYKLVILYMSQSLISVFVFHFGARDDNLVRYLKKPVEKLRRKVL